ncbi:MAG: hypothetical protein Kow0080_33980 [Candidatus Promineifilaceae bacterium]
MPTGEWLDGFMAAGLFALLGGRAGFVWVNSAYFLERPSQIWDIGQGGFFFHTALLGGLLGLWAWSWWHKRPFLPTADTFAPALLITGVFGWAACWLEGCAYGQETFLGLFSADLPDSYSIFAVRYQTQLAGILLTLIGLPLVWPRFTKPGTAFWTAVFWLNVSRIPITLFRGDPMPQWGGVRADLILETAFALFALTAVLLLQYKSSSNRVTR